MESRMRQLVAWVRAYALEHYNKDGWDVLVECWEDDEIEREIGSVCTLRQAIARVRRSVKLYDDVRRDIQGA